MKASPSDSSLENNKNNSYSLSKYEQRVLDEFKAWIDCHPDWWVIVLKNYGGGRKVFRCFKAYSRFDRV